MGDKSKAKGLSYI